MFKKIINYLTIREDRRAITGIAMKMAAIAIKNQQKIENINLKRSGDCQLDVPEVNFGEIASDAVSLYRSISSRMNPPLVIVRKAEAA